MKLVLSVTVLLASLNCAYGKEAAGQALPHRAANRTLVAAAAPAPDVFRCKTESEWDQGSCTSPQPSPFNASAFDKGIGAIYPVDGVVAVYTLRFTAPSNGTVYNIKATKRPETDTFCPSGYVMSDSTGTQCYYGETGYLIYVKRRLGQWKIELLADDVLQWTAYSNVLAAQIRKISGDSATAPVGEAIRNKPSFSLYHFDNTLVDVAETSNGVNTDIVTFTITGPSKATGMSVSSPTYLWHATSAALDVTMGNKLGTYTVKGSIAGATMANPFTFTAVGREKGPDHPDNEEDDGDNPCSEKVADPVTLGTGNSFQQETDYPRTGLSILEFTRSYNGFGSNSRLMGNYWSTTYDRFVILPSSAGQPAKVRRPDGRTITFFDVGGLYQPHAYFEATLIKTGSGWTYTDQDRSIEQFDTTGRLLSITDPVGRSVTMTYDTTAGNLIKVTSNTGETLTFAYNTYKQLSSMTDSAGRVWTYTYNGYSNLISVARPFGASKNYYYDDPNNPFLMTSSYEGVSGYGPDYNGAANARWQYDAMGRVISNSFLGGLKKVDIAYLPDGSRVVTDSLGRVTTYHTQMVNGRGYVTEAVGPGFSACGMPDGSFQYDADMNVTAHTQFGRRTEYGNYDSKGQNGYLIEAAGTTHARRTDFVYDARFIGKPTRVTSPSVSPGRVKTIDLTYDAAGNVTSQIISGFRPDGMPISHAITYQYAGPFGQLSQIDGPRTDVADITKFDYDPTTKRLLRVTSPDGIVLRNNLTYTTTGQLATEDRPNGLKLAYTYIAGTNLIATLTETQGASTRKTTWTYTNRRQISSITFHDGVNSDLVVGFYYDEAGDLRAVVNPPQGAIDGGPGVNFTLDTEGNPIQDDKGTFSVSRTFDAYNRVDKLINFTGTTDYDYYPDGTLTRVTDGNYQVTSYEYDDFKRMTRAIQPSQIATVYGYDIQGHLIEVTDPMQAVTRYVVDDLGNRLQMQSPDSGTTSYAEDAAGNLIQQTDANGQATIRTYSAGNRPLMIDRTGASEDETFVYDTCVNGVGKLCRIDIGNGEFVAYEYDGFGRAIKVSTRAGAVSYTFDARDNVTAITYPSGRKVVYTYNTAGQATQVNAIENGRVFPLASNVQYLAMGPATSWTYGNGLAETRQYNAQNLPVSLGVPGKFSLSFPAYDGNGNLLQRTVGGQSETYGYDALNRLTSASGGFGMRSYVYDNGGNRTQVTVDGIVTDTTYQAQSNRLISDSSTSYSLDPNGNMLQRADAAGVGFQYGYSARNQLATVAQIGYAAGSAAVYVYNGLGQRTIKSINGTERRFIYGIDGNLLSESLADGTIIEEYVYLNGQPLALLGRAYQAGPTPTVDSIVDDTAGTMTGTWAIKNGQFAYGGKYRQLSAADPYTDHFAWNWRPAISGRYDIWVWWDRKPTDGTRTYYYVDGFNATGVIEHAAQSQGTWAYLGQFHLSAGNEALDLDEWQAQPQFGSLTAGVLMADAARFKLLQADSGQEGNYNFVINDQLGTPQAVMNRTGAVVWRATYDPFGAAVVNADPDGNGQPFTMNLRFAGQYFDAETGMQDNYFRTYDSNDGRYLQTDPMGLKGGTNAYAYVNSNPIQSTDRFGLAEWWEQVKGVGPMDAWTAFDDANAALDDAQKSGLGGLHNGPGDAYRHCLWSCLMTQHIGVDQARSVGDAHEVSGRSQGEPVSEEKMDRANNKAGRDCGRLVGDPRTCQQRCSDRLENGGLFGLGGTPMKPDGQ